MVEGQRNTSIEKQIHAKDTLIKEASVVVTSRTKCPTTGMGTSEPRVCAAIERYTSGREEEKKNIMTKKSGNLSIKQN